MPERERPQSYSEKYRGTEWGSPELPPGAQPKLHMFEPLAPRTRPRIGQIPKSILIAGGIWIFVGLFYFAFAMYISVVGSHGPIPLPESYPTTPGVELGVEGIIGMLYLALGIWFLFLPSRGIIRLARFVWLFTGGLSGLFVATTFDSGSVGGYLLAGGSVLTAIALVFMYGASSLLP
jgi:hypothetical protein